MVSEVTTRLEIVRRYLLDVEEHSGGLIEAGDAISYVAWNFQQAVLASISNLDSERSVFRQHVQSSSVDQACVVTVESPVESLVIGRMSPVIESAGRFAIWFHQKLISPVAAEENRILLHSSTREILTVGCVRSHVSRAAESFRFKVWEAANFPGAKSVPPRVEPSPDEVSPPQQRCE